jgi:hypothetical protein
MDNVKSIHLHLLVLVLILSQIDFRLARALPRLRTLEIINRIEQQEKSVLVMKTNIDFSRLSVLILYDIHIDYAEQKCYESIDTIRNFFPQAYYVKHGGE